MIDHANHHGLDFARTDRSAEPCAPAMVGGNDRGDSKRAELQEART